MAKLQSNHRFYKSCHDHIDTHLVQTEDKTLEATHSYRSFAFPEIYSL